ISRRFRHQLKVSGSMREHLDDTDATRFSRREMSVQELLEADEHLSKCVECRNRLAAAIGWRGGVLRTAPELSDTEASSKFAGEPSPTYASRASWKRGVVTADSWQQVSKVYHAALQYDGRDRAAFVRDACAGDEALQREVESLLGYGSA